MASNAARSWKIENGTFDWTVVVPPNTRATVYLPVKDGCTIKLEGKPVSGTVHDVGAGKYHFVVG